MATKPSIPKGTRDFGPQEMLRRKWIFNTIEKVFQLHGFLPLETPAMENLETLTGKYGEEGDRLIFKILNSGDFMAPVRERWFSVWDDMEVKLTEAMLRDLASAARARLLSEKALRYDLTVPFARYVVQHQNELTFPFKRYQIQPVWRADRPQKGRYREFYQCDADIIGSNGVLNEFEVLSLILNVFARLSLNVEVHINNRKFLKGFAKLVGVEDRLVEFLVILDKIDKIGLDGIIEEYRVANFPEASISRIADLHGLFSSLGGPENIPDLYGRLKVQFEAANSPEGIMGLQEMEALFDVCRPFLRAERPSVVHDFSLARGLDYYTGAIFEVKAAEGSLQSSICGGGRYDDLTGVFGLKGMSGVGISFGADRIYDVLEELGRFPKDLTSTTQVLFINFGGESTEHCLKLAQQCRAAGISTEVYPDGAERVKVPKQMKYANDKGIPFVVLIGENELKQGIVTVKDMRSGEQKAVKEVELITFIGRVDGSGQ